MHRPLIYRIQPDETLAQALRRNASWFLTCKTPLGRSYRLARAVDQLGCRLVGHVARDEAEPGGQMRCRFCGTLLEVAVDRPLITAPQLAEALAWHPDLHDHAAAWLRDRQASGSRFADAHAAARAYLAQHAEARSPITLG
ncbi:hypothetical protein AB0F93_03595 [Micromonospora tulbaghiae]|uniref:hypothetical protein n=1 Tax=Micromonospora tulbaghiae TaxID=479978 RepID=UPI00332CD383